MPLSRRELLRGALVAPAAGALSGCTALEAVNPLTNPIRVAVTWSGDELAKFRQVLEKFERTHGEPTLAISYGDEIETALSSRASGAPDVILLPRIGALGSPEIRANLAPIEAKGLVHKASWDERFVLGWSTVWHDGKPYGVPFKVANKSRVWYREDIFEKAGVLPPRDWASWLNLVQWFADDVALLPNGMAPLALAAADDWMMTDFFENVLLQSFAGKDGDQIDAEQMLRPDVVAGGLRRFGELLSIPNAIAGGAEWALVRQFHDAVLDVFRYDRAAMVVAPDFAGPIITTFGKTDAKVDDFRFPPVNGDNPPPLLVGGDIAVLAAHADRRAVELVRWLGTGAAQLAWIGGERARRRLGADDHIGFVPANLDVCRRRPGTDLVGLDLDLCPREVPGRPGLARPNVVFDPSDQTGVTGVLGRALQDFLSQVAGAPERIDAASRPVLDALKGAVG